MDLPSEIDPHAEVIIEGIMSEEVEEINDAYKDILEELGENLIKCLLLPMDALAYVCAFLGLRIHACGGIFFFFVFFTGIEEVKRRIKRRKCL